jgi:hypothetical protein
MSGPDDTSRERHDRPNDQPQSPQGAEDNGHAIPFGEGVYGLGRSDGPARQQPRSEPPSPDPPPSARTSERPGYSPGSGTFGDEPSAGGSETGPDFDFRRLAEELGFEGHVEGRQCVGFCPICRSADLLRTVATPELRAAWSEFARELARALGAAAERYAQPQAESGDRPPRVTEIPID